MLSFVHTTHYCNNRDYYKGDLVEPGKHCASLQEICSYFASKSSPSNISFALREKYEQGIS